MRSLDRPKQFCSLTQEGVRKHNFWTANVKSIKIYIVGFLASRAIDWYICGSNRRGGGRGGPELFGPPLQKFRVTPTKF